MAVDSEKKSNLLLAIIITVMVGTMLAGAIDTHIFITEQRANRTLEDLPIAPPSGWADPKNKS